MNGESKKILVTVKAYPNPSKKYVETICVAGIDLESGKWVRVYPIPFRDLDEGKKFKKYTIIQVKAIRPKDDKRPESFRVNVDSIKLIDFLDTKDKWKRRKEITLPTVSESFCEILRENIRNKKSLGVFKPTNVKFTSTKIKIGDKSKRESCYAQLSFFDKRKNAIEQIPYEFRYQFKCLNEPDCPGHDLLIIDWEIGQAYRDWRHKYKPEGLLLEKIEERWLNRMCSPENDTYFFVGNVHRFPTTFMVLGVFYPPKLAL